MQVHACCPACPPSPPLPVIHACRSTLPLLPTLLDENPAAGIAFDLVHATVMGPRGGMGVGVGAARHPDGKIYPFFSHASPSLLRCTHPPSPASSIHIFACAAAPQVPRKYTVPGELDPVPLRAAVLDQHATGQHQASRLAPLVPRSLVSRSQTELIRPSISSPLQGSLKSIDGRQGSATQGVRPDSRVGRNNLALDAPRDGLHASTLCVASMSEDMRPGDPGSRPCSHSSSKSGGSASSMEAANVGTDQGSQLASSYGPPLLRPQMSRRVTAMLERTTFSGGVSANGAGASYINEGASGGGSGAGHVQVPPMHSLVDLSEGSPLMAPLQYLSNDGVVPTSFTLASLGPHHRGEGTTSVCGQQSGRREPGSREQSAGRQGLGSGMAQHSTGGPLPTSEVACATASASSGHSITSVCERLGGRSGRSGLGSGMTRDLAVADSWAPLALPSRPASVHPPPPGTPALYDMLASLQFDVATQQQVSVYGRQVLCSDSLLFYRKLTKMLHAKCVSPCVDLAWILHGSGMDLVWILLDLARIWHGSGLDLAWTIPGSGLLGRCIIVKGHSLRIWLGTIQVSRSR